MKGNTGAWNKLSQTLLVEGKGLCWHPCYLLVCLQCAEGFFSRY